MTQKKNEFTLLKWCWSDFLTYILDTAINTATILHVQEYAWHAIKSIKTRIYKAGGNDGEYFGEKPIDLHAGNVIIGEFQ